MRFRVHEVFLGVFLTVAVFSMGMTFSSTIFPPKQAAERGSDNDHSKQKAPKVGDAESADDRIAKYTLWLAILTGGLVTVSAFQGYFLIRSDQTARKAAEAAGLSAKAAIAIELPIIQASPAKLMQSIENDVTGTRRHVCTVGQLRFSNRGRTDGLLIEVQIGLTIGDQLVNEPVYRYTHLFPITAVLTTNPNAAVDVVLHQYEFDAPADLSDQLRTGSTKLWFYCKLVYLDFMDVRHEAGFCWKQYETSGMGVLRPDGAAAYNRKT